MINKYDLFSVKNKMSRTFRKCVDACYWFNSDDDHASDDYIRKCRDKCVDYYYNRPRREKIERLEKELDQLRQEEK